MTKTLDSVYMLVNKGTGGIWYSPPATNPRECWNNASAWEQWNRGGVPIIGWEANMRLDGWRARKVSVTE